MSRIDFNPSDNNTRFRENVSPIGHSERFDYHRAQKFSNLLSDNLTGESDQQRDRDYKRQDRQEQQRQERFHYDQQRLKRRQQRVESSLRANEYGPEVASDLERRGVLPDQLPKTKQRTGARAGVEVGGGAQVDWDADVELERLMPQKKLTPAHERTTNRATPHPQDVPMDDITERMQRRQSGKQATATEQAVDGADDRLQVPFNKLHKDNKKRKATTLAQLNYQATPDRDIRNSELRNSNAVSRREEGSGSGSGQQGSDTGGQGSGQQGGGDRRRSLGGFGLVAPQRAYQLVTPEQEKRMKYLVRRFKRILNGEDDVDTSVQNGTRTNQQRKMRGTKQLARLRAGNRERGRGARSEMAKHLKSALVKRVMYFHEQGSEQYEFHLHISGPMINDTKLVVKQVNPKRLEVRVFASSYSAYLYFKGHIASLKATLDELAYEQVNVRLLYVKQAPKLDEQAESLDLLAAPQ